MASVSEEAPLPTGKTPELSIDRTEEAGGHKYHYTIERRPVETTVTDEDGNVFYDNSISLAVQRDGSVLYSRTFTREDFLPMLDKGFCRYGILDGCRFVEIKGGNVVFSLCVSYPESDMLAAYLLTIHADGSATFSPDNTLDVENLADSAALSVGN